MGLTVIRTPTDIRTFVGKDGAEIREWVVPEANVEPRYREAYETIFSDWAMIEAWDQRQVSAYLESLGPPLTTLWNLGFQLVAGVSKGSKAVGSEAVAWHQARFIVADDPSYFRAAEGRVHKLGISCPDADATIFRDPIQHWSSVKSVSTSLEGSVPWCATCAGDAPELVL